jgi:CheY-like chemotaxis protein
MASCTLRLGTTISKRCSIVVDDEPDIADLYCQHFGREARQGTDVLHFAGSGEEALQLFAHGIEPQLIVIRRTLT